VLRATQEAIMLMTRMAAAAAAAAAVAANDVTVSINRNTDASSC